MEKGGMEMPYDKPIVPPGYFFNPRTGCYEPYTVQKTEKKKEEIREDWITGRVINGPNEVMPKEIPNDGSYGIYPMADCSAIYAKAWTPDGMIETIRYLPEEKQEKLTQEDINRAILGQLVKTDKTIEELLKAIRKDDTHGKTDDATSSESDKE